MNKKKILVIDDETELTSLIKLNLEETGSYAVRIENKGSLGLVAAQEFKPDLIFLDIMMPDMDGGDVCRELENDSRTKNIPIVFLTAVAKKEEIKEGKGVIGGYPFLGKPVSLKDLVDCIQSYK